MFSRNFKYDEDAVEYTLTSGWTETSFLIWTCFDRQLEALWKRLSTYIICGIGACQTDEWSGHMVACEKNVIFRIFQGPGLGPGSVTSSTDLP